MIQEILIALDHSTLYSLLSLYIYIYIYNKEIKTKKKSSKYSEIILYKKTARLQIMLCSKLTWEKEDVTCVHTWNLCSAFNPSKGANSYTHTHPEQWAANAAAPGASVPCSRSPQSWY